MAELFGSQPSLHSTSIASELGLVAHSPLLSPPPPTMPYTMSGTPARRDRDGFAMPSSTPASILDARFPAYSAPQSATAFHRTSTPQPLTSPAPGDAAQKRLRTNLEQDVSHHSGGLYHRGQAIEELIARAGLEAERDFLYGFYTASVEDKMFHVLSRQILAHRTLEEHTGVLKSLSKSVNLLVSLAQQQWQPSDAQAKLLRNLVRHYVIQDVATYKAVASMVQAIVLTKGHMMRLELYRTDATVRYTVDQFVSKQTTQQKSSLRKSAIASVRSRLSLDEWTKIVIQSYQMSSEPATDAIRARLALLRKIAAPHVKKKNSEKVDTGYWKDVEKELTELYVPPDGDMRSPASRAAWERAIIAEDNAAYSYATFEVTEDAAHEARAALEDDMISEHGDHNDGLGTNALVGADPLTAFTSHGVSMDADTRRMSTPVFQMPPQ